MTPDQFRLLLTAARILRATRAEACDHFSAEDVGFLDEALAPWAAVKQSQGDDGADQ